MVSHKVANTFIRKYNNHFQIKGYSKLNIVDKKKLIESKLRSLSSDSVRQARSEWQTLKEGLSKTSVKKAPTKTPTKAPTKASSRASTASSESTTPAPPSLRLSIRSSQKDRVSSLISSRGSSRKKAPTIKKSSPTGFSDVDRVDVRKVGMVPGGGFTHSDMMYKTKEEKRRELDARMQALYEQRSNKTPSSRVSSKKASSTSSSEGIHSVSDSESSSYQKPAHVYKKRTPSARSLTTEGSIISVRSSDSDYSNNNGNAPFSHSSSSSMI
jgi:hypothetical protein